VSELLRPVFTGLVASGYLPLALKLFPKLFPEHVFVVLAKPLVSSTERALSDQPECSTTRTV
jgi:hypothetical protein